MGMRIYERFEPEGSGPIAAEQALDGINRIRNSIVGAQNINWSEHIYPLVALLNRAGYEGMSYPEAKANIGTLIDRAENAEATLRAIVARCLEVPVGTPCFPLARALGDMAAGGETDA